MKCKNRNVFFTVLLHKISFFFFSIGFYRSDEIPFQFYNMDFIQDWQSDVISFDSIDTFYVRYIIIMIRLFYYYN